MYWKGTEKVFLKHGAITLHNACLNQLLFHFALQFQSLFTRFISEISALRSINNATGTVDQKTAILIHPIFTNILQRSSLSTHTRHEQEMIRCMFTDF